MSEDNPGRMYKSRIDLSNLLSSNADLKNRVALFKGVRNS
jgi:hypothetical protein